MLGSINDMRFLAPVMPGDQMQIAVQILKMAGDITLVEGTVKVGKPRSPAVSSASRDGQSEWRGSEGSAHPCRRVRLQ